MKTGVILANVGTPKSPAIFDVKEYLAEFLMDPDIIGLPFLFRWLLVHGIILRKRPKVSSEAYQKIWTDRGSPLRWYTEDLSRELESILNRKSKDKREFIVVPAMRYGEPSLKGALERLRRENIDELMVFPLFPHEATATTGSARKELARLLKQMTWNIPVKEIPRFFRDSNFIQCWQVLVRPFLESFKPDVVVMSFHGLPVKQGGQYRTQCFETASLIAEGLGLRDYVVTFQSRLGRTAWIEPYTDDKLKELAHGGKRRVLVFCPAFVMDCLETIEEIGLRSKEMFVESGGQDFCLVPCLNLSEAWLMTAVEFVKRETHDEQRLVEESR